MAATVKKVIEFLKQFPEDMEVIYELHSDYHELFVEPDSNTDFQKHTPSLVYAIPKKHSEEWLERYYPEQYRKGEQVKYKQYLCFPGN